MIDLTPDDGILPSITFGGADGKPSLWQHTVSASVDGVNAIRSGNGYGASVWNGSGASGMARLTPVSLLSEVSIGGAPLASGGGVSALTGLTTAFLLSANTRVIFRAAFELETISTGLEMARAAIAFGLWGVPGASTFDSELDAGTRSALIQETTFNGADALNGSIYLSASVGASAPASPVPEPASWGMLLAGVAVVGMVARRRRQ